MTAKRFEIVKSKLIKDGWVISDKLKQFTFPTLKGDKRALVSYCKALNELHEENNELRLQLNLCSDQRNEFHRGARENANRVGKLKKENEQLKSFIKSLANPDGRIWLSSGYGYRIDKILNDFNNTENDDGDDGMTKESYSFGVDTEARLHTETSGMTAKRLFSAVKGHKEHIVDHTGRLYSDNEVANLLNELTEENEEFNEELLEYDTFKKVYGEKIERLEKENEQLKTELTELKASKEDNYNY